MFERMRANELLENIHSGEIKNNSKINVIYDDEIIDSIEYKNGRLERRDNGKFDTKYLCDIETEFEVVDDEINIEEIQEIDATTEAINDFMVSNSTLIQQDRNKINELIRAIKQINRKMEE